MRGRGVPLATLITPLPAPPPFSVTLQLKEVVTYTSVVCSPTQTDIWIWEHGSVATATDQDDLEEERGQQNGGSLREVCCSQLTKISVLSFYTNWENGNLLDLTCFTDVITNGRFNSFLMAE